MITKSSTFTNSQQTPLNEPKISPKIFMNTLFILDVSAYIFRSYYAIRNMSNGEGLATNALFGFVRSIHKLRTDFSPTHLLAVFDPPDGKKSRLALYKEYKAHRETIPEDLPHQIEWAKEFCSIYGLPSLEVPGVEADDTIGSVAVWAKKNQFKVFVCSSDKDLCQLVDENIHVLHTHKENKILDSQRVFDTFGVYPNQIIDYLAMTGDSADNVPGLSGFGPKTAAKLLQEHHTLDHILNHPDTVPGKKKQQTLIEEKESAYLSRKLVTLDLNITIPLDPSFYTLKPPQTEKLIPFYKEKNFTTFLKDLDSPHTPSSSTTYTLIDTKEALDQLIHTLSQANEIAFDTETTSKYPLHAQIVGFGFCIEEGKAFYVPCNAKIPKQDVLHTLKPLFENRNLSFFGHNVKYDAHVLANVGIQLANISFDTILASHLLNPDNQRHSLDQLSLHYFNKQKIPLDSLIGKGKKTITMDHVPIENVSEYCCEDADYTFRLKQLLSKELNERALSHLLTTIELPVLNILFAMERRGIYVDASLLQTQSKKLVAIIQHLEEQIHTLAGESFTINSPKQLSRILFDKLEIPPPKKTATGYSTNAEVLDSLKENYPIAEHVLHYRQLEKLRSTYLDALPNEINPNTGRIHSTYTQFVTSTGRLSSQNPNLQNIPIRSEEGRLVRAGFLPEKSNWSFLSADYSQIELRILAHMSEDPELIKAFQNGEDIHAYTASLMFNTPLKEVTKQERYQAKTVNFGIIYGQQAFGLAKELKVDRHSAALFIETYFQRYPKVKEFIHSCQEQARKTGRTRTLNGRERPLPEIDSKNKNLRSAAERLAINSPIQGTAADLIKLAMIAVDRRIKEFSPSLEGYMLLQIHDELLFELPDTEINHFKQLTIKGMRDDMWDLKIPLEINITIGKNWKEC